MKKYKALILCGGPSQLHLINILHKNNIETVLADINENAVAVKYADKYYRVSTLDYSGIRDVALKENINLIFSVCADQMLLVAAKLSEELNLPFYINYETAKNVSDKALMKQIFVDNDIPTSKYIISDDVEKKDLKDLSFPLVVKPVDAYSSKGVKKVDDYDELEIAFSQAVQISRTKTAVVEEFFGGIEVSIDVFVEEGKAKILCVRTLDKIPNSNGFVICRGIYPANISSNTFSNLKKVSQQIATAFELENTPMLIQAKIDGEKISVIEFCARTGGGIKYRLIPYLTGFDVVEAVVDITLGKKVHYDECPQEKFIVDEFLYCNPGKLKSIEGFESLQNDGIISHYEFFKKEGHEFSVIKSSSDRVAYFSVESDDINDLKKKHKLVNKRIKVLDSNGKDILRHDIIESFT